jgi:exopolysaccharide biosynthesis polyprenyl glycosylphosphotransferase
MTRVPTTWTAQATTAAERGSVTTTTVRQTDPRIRLRAPDGVVAAPVAGWLRRYAALLAVADFLSASAAAAFAFSLRFGTGGPGAGRGALYLGVALALPVVWVALMGVGRAYEERFLGLGSEEFKRVGNVAVRVTALVALVSYAAKLEVARGYVIVALPMALTLSLLVRVTARRLLHGLRRRGRCVHRAILIGHESAVLDMLGQVRRQPDVGFAVVAACLTRPEPSLALADALVPAYDLSDLLAAIHDNGADTVAVTSSAELSGVALRRLSWSLEGTGVDLLVAPALTDIAGTRIHIRPVSGLPLLHVEEPQLSGGRRLAKVLLDRSLAAFVLLLTLPALLVLGLVVRLGSRGPALFRQERVGRDGSTFTMLKFRSMHTDAEDRLGGLSHRNAHGEGVLFKIKDDPRVTRSGRWLRRFSLDELPQLLNVLAGHMSLVGPRPPLPKEVARYGDDVRRRLLVKPGLTGLWQVSGRSDLPWDEAVRLDLHYVENWSLALDLMIMVRTLRAVVRTRGAY